MQNLQTNVAHETKKEIFIDSDDPLDDYLDAMKAKILKNKDCKLKLT
jgi:hypothetical protein